MARLFTTGIECGDLGDFAIVSNAAASVATVRTGTYSLSITATNGYAQWNHTAAPSEFFVRIPFNRGTSTSGGRILSLIYGGTEVLSLRLDQDTFQLTTYLGSSDSFQLGTGSHSLNTSTWYLIEAHVVVHSSGTFDVRVDGDTDMEFSGDTQSGTTPGVSTFKCMGWATCFFDDIAINDTTGDSQNSWAGDGYVYNLMPNAAGDVTGLTPSAGDNYACVDEIPADGDTSYVAASAADLYDLYHLDYDANITGRLITLVQPWATAKESFADGGAVQLGVKPAASESWSASRDLQTSYARAWGDVYYANPETAADWEDSDLQTLQVGVKVK